MNEQDLIHTIDEKTKNLPVPDSITPESMKKMLDAHTTSAEHIIPEDKDQPSPTRNRSIRRFTAAACVVLCLVGGVGISQLLSGSSHGDMTADSASSDMADTPGSNLIQADESTADETDVSVSESADTGATMSDLAYQTSLKSPSSYEEYYQTLKSAYDAYYDQLSQVFTDKQTDIEEDVEEYVDGVRAFEEPMNTNTTVADPYAASADTGGNLTDFSTTNTQEETVDEGDIIKTDGTNIYKVISAFDNRTRHTSYKLTMTRTDNGKLSLMTSIDLDDVLQTSEDDSVDFQEFYLYEDRLIFLYDKTSINGDDDSTTTYVVVYDVKDKKNPKLIKTLSQSGWYQSTRISDGYLYTISNFTDTSLYDEKQYRNYIPYIGGKPIACEDIYYPTDISAETTHVITSLNLKHPTGFTDSKAIPSSGYQYYVSDSAIYLYATAYNEITRTEIMKVGYQDGLLTAGSSAVITGYLYDTFALNEYDGYLRIVATIPANNIIRLGSLTTDTATDSVVREDVNTLYILDENMKLTGKITGIAPGETIYSARFFGDTGYFVTYKNMDPLFSVDLSDPANPAIIGSLKITGFSEYLHFYDTNLLLGIGMETDPETQEFLGLKLSMFDISDPSNVTEQDKYIIEHSEYSDALNNHKAIMIDPKKNIFGFLYFGTVGKDYNYYSNKYYYVTYTYDKEKGFVQTASYPVTDGSEYEYDAVRGVYIGDYFYLATNRTITSYRIGSEEAIATVNLQ
ncbi:MAG: beta-propeller domain-containing protein [Lachnospiraceae bacterium]|nr:beta-propeller domain-containing protein [Lachnospiraceae bacterium]